MSVRCIDELPSVARAEVEQYLAEVEAGMGSVDTATVDETIGSVVSHVCETLDADASLDDVRSVLTDLGEPETFGAYLCDVVEPATGPDADAYRVLGVPIELRLPTAQRVASRWWAPTDPRLLVPRVFGIGWDLNFGAAAVRLHLIEPDAEDEPFASTPERSFAIYLLVPLALFAALVVSYVAARSSLPTRLPVHWGINGQADRFAPAMWAFAPLAIMSAAASGWAVWSVVTRRAPLQRAAVIGLATFVSGLAVALWALTLLTVDGVESAWLPPALIISGALLAPLAVLTGLARAGRHSEIMRDVQEGRN